VRPNLAKIGCFSPKGLIFYQGPEKDPHEFSEPPFLRTMLGYFARGIILLFIIYKSNSSPLRMGNSAYPLPINLGKNTYLIFNNLPI
jgi:hypothetical protein